MSQDAPIRLDVGSVLRQRLPERYGRWIPRALVRWLERFIRQDSLNDILEHTAGLTGAPFCRSVLEYLDIDYTVDTSVAGLPDQQRVMFVSNHPLGALDGIIIIDMLARKYGAENLYFVVNDLLTAVTPLNDIFVPINKHGAQSRQAASRLDMAMASDGPVIVFPAGLVSRRKADGSVSDLEWNKMFINKAVAYHRDVVPLYFEGTNSDFFYTFARRREQLGIKFNFEMLRLPAEIFDSKGRHYTIRPGHIIPWQELKTGPEARAEAARIKRILYSLSGKHQSDKSL